MLHLWCHHLPFSGPLLHRFALILFSLNIVNPFASNGLLTKTSPNFGGRQPHVDVEHHYISIYLISQSYTKDGILFCGYASLPVNNDETLLSPPTLEHLFHNLPSPLRDILGLVQFPSDDAIQLVNDIKQNGNNIFGASDASFRDGQATHAWMLSTGKVTDLDSGNMTITGIGHVERYAPHMSSTRGELYGVTALSIMADLLCQHAGIQGSLLAICDNQEVVTKCNSTLCHNLRCQRNPNFDLLFTHQH